MALATAQVAGPLDTSEGDLAVSIVGGQLRVTDDPADDTAGIRFNVNGSNLPAPGSVIASVARRSPT